MKKQQKRRRTKMNKLRLAWVVSLVATLGSLYYSEIMGFQPCKLCWFARILMYPLPIILGVALIRNDKKVIFYTLPLSIIGVLLETYHYLHQKTDWFDKVQTCNVGVPCKGAYINWFGFITIPFQALTAFVIITVLSFFILRDIKKEKQTEDTDTDPTI